MITRSRTRLRIGKVEYLGLARYISDLVVWRVWVTKAQEDYTTSMQGIR